MRNEKLWMFTVGLISAMVHGCYNDGEVCQVGMVVLCEGASGCTGLQTCTPEGKFGPCDCEEEGTSGSGGSSGSSSGAVSTETSGGETVGEGEASTAGEPGTSTQDSTTGHLGPEDAECEQLCKDGGKCGAIDCAGEYYDCGGCKDPEVCMDGECAPPCESRELTFINAGVAVSPLVDEMDVGCTVKAMAYMEMTMEISGDPTLTVSLERGEHTIKPVPFGKGPVLMLKCSRRAPYFQCGEYAWIPCEGDIENACDEETIPVEIDPYDCSPEPIIGCEAP